MKLLQNILSTIDMGESSDNVVDSSIYLAKKFNSQITLMHVIVDENISPELMKIIRESVELKMKGISEKIQSEGISVGNIIIEYGVPFEKIINEAQNNNYNVIVAGSGNKLVNDSFKLGTTVEKMIRKNQIPLWVVKNEKFEDIERIVCPVDFSSASARALNNAITLADKFMAELFIINVFSPVSVFSSRFEVDNKKENAQLQGKQIRDFENFLHDFNFGNITYKTEMLEGEPYKEILNYLKQKKADLLLLGTTGKTVLSKLLMGSVTEKVTREVPCSFITTKAKDITDSYFESNLNSVESILNSAKRSFVAKDFEKANEKYINALKQYPDNIPVILGLIETNKAMGNIAKQKHYTEYAEEVIKRIWGDEYLDKFEIY